MPKGHIDPIDETDQELKFRVELASLLNRYSRENKSNTPDHVLADYLLKCLVVYEHTVSTRDRFLS